MAVAYSGNFRMGPQNGKLNDGTQAVSNTGVLDTASNDPIINIHVSCKDIIKLDIGSPSDPMVVMFVPVNGKYVEVARTEVIWDDPNPSFVKFFQALYIFETQQPLRFMVYDCDSENAPLEKHDFIGYADTDVQTLVSAGSSEVRLELKHNTAKNKRGTLILTSEQASSSNSICNMTISTFDLRKMRTFSKNWPYVQISKPSESGKLLPIFRSEVVPKTYKCTFKPIQIPLQVLCNGDPNVPVTISIMDYKRNHADDLIGSFTLSLQTFIDNGSNSVYEIQNGTAKKKKKCGKFRFLTINIIKKPTFCDYIRSGLQLNLITAIDFTASNMNPTDPRSLHYITPNGLNQYETCIWSIGSVVCPYDSDQLFPVYGFGGKINGVVSHCFPLTFDPNNPNVQGLEGISMAYKNSLRMVQLSGPTLFAPIISAATGVARASFQESHTYTILMILTDGIINDMQETIDAIVEASDAPLSIIIVGVGCANFASMNILDADDDPLRSRSGVLMKRDIVQFVPFNKFAANNGMGLAQEVLAEVPRQVDQFCSTHGFIPQI
ncbi:Copine family protein [Histomonas meleagridis]|uniref:Copine family protein n=1 Tax=Histomonas meleagridis TaxID=135588 RepID=UPI00355ACB77|nr:Copine family protein [Histomonas meleagridis]KAH0796530.1 Copine family protein [Histomonas meleagridis]